MTNRLSHKLIGIFLALCLLLTAVPFAATAEVVSGTTGELTWSYNTSLNELTISGDGAMADYLSESNVPWFQLSGHVYSVIFDGGVTHIGDNAFAHFGALSYIDLPDTLQTIGERAFAYTGLHEVDIPGGVTSVSARAFEGCSVLSTALLPESLQSVGIMAFGGTALQGISVPNRSMQIGLYAFGYDTQGNKTGGFSVSGYSGSTAQTFARGNSFTFIDLDAKEYALRVYMGRAINVVSNRVVEKARAGERIMIDKKPSAHFNLESYMTPDAELEEIDGTWYFTMPDHTVTVYINGTYDRPINIEFSYSDYQWLESEKYIFLVKYGYLDFCRTADLGDGAYLYDLDGDGSDDVRIDRDGVTKLDTASITTSIAFYGENGFGPITFLFSKNSIDRADVTLTLPEAGESYSYATDSADVTVEPEKPYSVVSAKWFTEWGIAPETFEAGQKYIAEITLRPNEGYAFLANAYCFLHGVPMSDGSSTEVYELRDNGDIVFYTAPVVIPGALHAVTVSGGMGADHADEYSSANAIHEARAGDRIWLSVGTDDLAEDEFAVIHTINYHSDDVIIEGEAQRFFIMPDEPVTVDVTFEREKQMNGTMDLRGGKVYSADTSDYDFTAYDKSEAFGIHCLLIDLSEGFRGEWDSENGRYLTMYDIDGDGSDDVAENEGDFFLLDTCSLSSPSGAVTLHYEQHADCLTFPMRSLKIIFADGDELLGDVDGDGEVTIMDATFIQRWLADLSLTFTLDEKTADVDGNGTIEVTDATFIQRFVNQIETPYNIGKAI